MATRTQIPPCGVANRPCSKPSNPGISLSFAIEYVTRTPVFRQASVVPISASSTVKATSTDTVVPPLPTVDFSIDRSAPNRRPPRCSP